MHCLAPALSVAGQLDTGNVATLFVGGGIGGDWRGARLAQRRARMRGAFDPVSAIAVVAVAVHMLVRNTGPGPRPSLRVSLAPLPRTP